MIFLDTSAIYALADAGDPAHSVAIKRFQEILDRGEQVLTHNYVLLESISLLQARLGFLAAAKFANESAAFLVEWVDKDLHASGIRQLEKSGKRRISLVDHISFLVMKRRNLTTAFAFDPDFKAEGFGLFGD
jgi:predicted nucleic acid-binding protein